LSHGRIVSRVRVCSCSGGAGSIAAVAAEIKSTNAVAARSAVAARRARGGCHTWEGREGCCAHRRSCCSRCIHGSARGAGSAPGDPDRRAAQDLALRTTAPHTSHQLPRKPSLLQDERNLRKLAGLAPTNFLLSSIQLLTHSHCRPTRSKLPQPTQLCMSHLGSQAQQALPASDPWPSPQQSAAQIAQSHSPCQEGSWCTRCRQSGQIACAGRPRSHLHTRPRLQCSATASCCYKPHHCAGPCSLAS
jgi:hypothetical protein